VGDGIIHVGHVGDGHLEVGQQAQATVDATRDHTRRNHTATHLAHWALQQVLGDEVTQQGSFVDEGKLRFDFDHRRAMTREEIEEVERLVNAKIYENLPVGTRVLPTEEAKSLPGVRAFFGEKYGDEVRVVEIGDGFSREFCGGTHLSQTGEIGLFKIVTEEAVAKGVRRIVALTGRGAVEYVIGMDRHLREAASMLNTGPEQLSERITALQKEVKALKKKAASGAVADVKALRRELTDGAERLAKGALIVAELPEIPVPRMRELIDWLRDDLKTAAIFVATRSEGKALLMASFTDDLVAAGFKAGDLVREIAPIVGGSGGGKPTLAQAGGKNPDAVPEALAKARALVSDRLS
jgi:alanyl-tRNA synthetase